MKRITKTILSGSILAAAVLQTSCVVPYDATVTSTQTYEPGYTVTTLPGDYRTEVIAGTNYYYHNGAYYQRRGGSYVVVDAPRQSRYYNEYTRRGRTTYHNHADGSAHVISELPRGYSTVEYRGVPYYRYQDRYYRRQGSGYIVVANPF